MLAARFDRHGNACRAPAVLAVLGCAMLFAFAPSANAGPVSLQGSVVKYKTQLDYTVEENNVLVSMPSERVIEIRDVGTNGVPPKPNKLYDADGPGGCSVDSTGVATCPVPSDAGVPTAWVEAGWGDDMVNFSQMADSSRAIGAGDGGNDRLYGHQGFDYLLGGAAVCSQTGSVTYDDANDGSDVLRGNGGDDTVGDCGGKSNTLDGGLGADHVTAGGDSDVADGGQGNDFVQLSTTATENATLLGGAGNDTLKAGPGNDTLSGGAGVNTLIGNAGDDTLYSDNSSPSTSWGQGVLYGGPGDDKLFGGHFRDFLFGEAGDDTARGSNGNDIYDGGAGADKLGETTDHVTTGGDDFFIIKDGTADTINTCGPGSDTVISDPGLDTVPADCL